MKRVTRENTDEGVETHLVRCECSTHMLQVTVFDDDLGDDLGDVGGLVVGGNDDQNAGRILNFEF